MLYTPLKISKQLHDLGIECESEKYWSDGKIYLSANSNMTPLTENQYFAYSLGELPAVLKAVGEKLKWDKEPQDGYISFVELMDEPYWNYCFVHMCELYATNPTKAFEYLGELLSGNK